MWSCGMENDAMHAQCDEKIPKVVDLLKKELQSQHEYEKIHSYRNVSSCL